MNDQFRIEDPLDFEKHVAMQCQRLGYEVSLPEKNTKGYDIKLVKKNEVIAVQVKNHKAKSNVSQLSKFQEFLELPIGSEFTSGWFISASGFSKPALTSINSEQPNNLQLGISSPSEIKWAYSSKEEFSVVDIDEGSNARVSDKTKSTLRYFGIFTCKGGVGKTTVAAHLAGAFALQGYDVILLDLDPDRNLRKLFLEDQNSDDDASLYVPSHKKGELGATITVLNADEWDERSYPDVKVVICDCSPVLSENPRELVKKFDYCVIPTTLNPLGIAKNGDVMTRTFKHIRDFNTTAEMFGLINCFNAAKTMSKRNDILLSALAKYINSYQAIDPKCQLIHPDYAKIRRSDSLLYWGYHIVDGSKPQLAFKSVAGRSAPRTDFLQLAEYLEDHTEIRSLQMQEAVRS